MFKTHYTDCLLYGSKNQVIDRPKGTNDYLFLYFPLPMYFILDGKKIITKKDACIIFSPGMPHYFHAETEFCNSFVHIDATAEDIKPFNLEYGKFFYPPNISSINNIINNIKTEFLENRTNSEVMIDSYIKQLLVLSERHFAKDNNNEIKQQFIDIRSDILQNYHKNYDMSSLATSVCMSRSRFYDYYKDFFNSSPKQDILNMRMQAAQILLSDKSKTTTQIAQEVGFENVEHFTRYYKKHFGTTPRYKQKSDKTSN